MKTFKILSILFAATALMYACKEDKLLMYSDEEAGNNIYFVEKYERRLADSLIQIITFGRAEDGKKDSLLKLPVAITGSAINQDRLIRVKPSDTSTMKEGVHFKFKTPPMIRANRTIDTLYVQLFRTADIYDKTVYVNLELQPNEYFKTNILTKTNLNVKQNIVNYSFSLSDQFPIPYLWTTFSGKNTVIGFFGPYSQRKVELFFEVLDADREFFYNPDVPLSIAKLISYSSYMKYWLNKEKSEGRTQYDENGKEITMGLSAN